MATGQDIHIRQLLLLFSNGFGSLTQSSLRRDAAKTTTHSTNDWRLLAAIAYSISFLPLEIQGRYDGGMCGLLRSSRKASPIESNQRLPDYVDTLVMCLSVNKPTCSFTPFSSVDRSWNSGYLIDPGHTFERGLVPISTRIYSLKLYWLTQ